MRGSVTMGVALALVSLALQACTTTLEVTPLAPGTAPASGNFAYALPKTVLVATGSVVLTGCRAIDTTGRGDYEPALDLAETIAVVPTYKADPKAQYQIPYEKLRSWSKEIQITVTSNQNKSLQGINSNVNDQSGPAALAGALAVVKIAGGLGIPAVPGVATVVGQAARGGLKFEDRDTDGKKHKPKPPFASKAPVVPPPPTYCSPDVQAALATIDKDTTQIRADAKQDATDKNTVPNQEIAQLQADIARRQIEAGLVRKFTFVWSPEKDKAPTKADGVFPYSQSLDLYTAYISPWLSSDGQEWFATHSATSKAHAVVDPVVLDLAVEAWTVGSEPSSTTSKDMILRDPALATLRICRGACLKVPEATLINTSADLAAPTSIAFGQFGRVVQLPLTNHPFENSAMVIAMNPDGAIISLANHSTGTLATNLATAGSIGDAIGTAQTQRNTGVSAQNSAITANAAAVDTVNKTLQDCLTTQAALVAKGYTPVGSCQ